MNLFFLCLVIHGPDHPGTKIDVWWDPWLKNWKFCGKESRRTIVTRNRSSTWEPRFLWSIHDFMAYGIFAGWSCHGILTCLICVEDTLCFRLKFGGKICRCRCNGRQTRRRTSSPRTAAAETPAFCRVLDRKTRCSPSYKLSSHIELWKSEVFCKQSSRFPKLSLL